MDKRGFTLVELIAVVVVLAVILAIAVPTITNVIKTSYLKAYELDLKGLGDSAKTYVLANNVEIENGAQKVITLDEMVLNGATDDIVDPRTKEKCEGYVIVINNLEHYKFEPFLRCADNYVSDNYGTTDLIPPTITILGSSTVSIYIGTTYNDYGATATDDIDGDITNKIIVSNNVNINAPGTYKVTYSVSDLGGNTKTLDRKVIVVDNVGPTITYSPNGNTTYARSRSTSVNVDDVSDIDNNSLKYVWTSNPTEPTVETINTSFADNATINTPQGVTGGYYLWVVAKDAVGNTKISRSNVFNLDNTDPVITLNGNSTVTVNRGSTYSDAGATASDNIDGVISVTSSGTVNINVVGTYAISYNATDSAGNVATQVIRTINVVDADAPILTLLGANPFNLYKGQTYVDPGATAVDETDGNVTSSIVKTGTVNPNVVGTYMITYTVRDNANNESVATRNINVLTNIFVYSFTGNYQTFTVPVAGNYNIELWGAGSASVLNGNDSGKGGYVSGNITLNKDVNLYIYVGGNDTNGIGGYNGGGSGIVYSNPHGGGGATDIRLVSGAWDNIIGLRSRIMVAGGSGASGWIEPGGNGGGLIGTSGVNERAGGYGTQTSGGAAGNGTTAVGTAGIFGKGGAGSSNNGAAGGGGGYYGGGGGAYSMDIDHGSGGGGSSFISGYLGCNAINESGNHTGQQNHYSGYVFTNGQMITGNNSMPSPEGGNDTGRTGNGYAKITFIP